MKNHGIEISNLHKNFHDIQALKGVSFKIADAGLYGLIGPNGAGKTTLLKCVSSLLVPSSGEVCINSDTVSPKNFAVRRKIGFLPEDSGLYEKLSAKEFLHIMAGMHGIPKEERKRKVKDVVDFVGITYPPNKVVKYLSTGQRRLLLFASILLHDPEILILDESLSGLDPINREHITRLMRKLAKDRIVLFSTHILADIWRLCKRIFVLNHGELIVEDHPENILARMSDNSYFITSKTELETIKDYLDNLPNVSVISIQDDKLLFKIEEMVPITEIIKGIMNKFNVESFGPNVPDLDQIFTRMVTAT
ncbi:MAG: ABC transporter ATP-binding protein [Candidatus Heimdallarchaeota archaeon]|nr:ABC transporter ATP-binding protein [Candidatus Heimdallarchaeota archaeon]